MKHFYNFFNKKWKTVVGLLFVPPIIIAVLSTYWKLTKFAFTIIFPCRISEYSWGTTQYCYAAEFFASISLVVTILLLMFFIHHVMEN